MSEFTADTRGIDHAFHLLAQDDAAARGALVQCHATAVAAADPAGQHLAAAGLLLAVAVDFADFRGLSEWLRWMDDAAAAINDSLAHSDTDPRDQARLDAARIVRPLLDDSVSTTDPQVVEAAARLTLALAGTPSLQADEHVLLWKALFDYRAHCLDTAALARIAVQAQDFLRSGAVSPRWQAQWWLLVARNHEYFGAPDAAADALARAHQLAQVHGLAGVRFELLCVEMTAALKTQAWSRVQAIGRDIELALPDVRAGRVPRGLCAQAWSLLWQGEADAAIKRLDRLLLICEDLEVPARDRGAYHVLRAYALLALRRFDEAQATLQTERQHQQGEEGVLLDAIQDLAGAMADVHAQHPQAAARVCAAIQRCAALQFERFLLPLPALAAQAAQIALDAGVQTEFVSRAVRTRKLVPADAIREDWPWRLKVRVLGPLEWLRDGHAPVMSGKRPKKPLELLALLVAQGRRPLPLDLALDALWPSLEAGDPKASLDAALSRLRKLLDVPDAIQLTSGGLRLDPCVVWTDVSAFETLEERALSGPVAHGAEDGVTDAAQQALALYRGALLAGETVGATLRLLREQLARRQARLLLRHGQSLELRGQWREAAELYEQGLARDVLAEPLYRALMRAQLQQGERAEALRTYARCRDLLASMLGVAPSEETLALRLKVTGGAA